MVKEQREAPRPSPRASSAGSQSSLNHPQAPSSPEPQARSPGSPPSPPASSPSSPSSPSSGGSAAPPPASHLPRKEQEEPHFKRRFSFLRPPVHILPRESRGASVWYRPLLTPWAAGSSFGGPTPRCVGQHVQPLLPRARQPSHLGEKSLPGSPVSCAFCPARHVFVRSGEGVRDQRRGKQPGGALTLCQQVSCVSPVIADTHQGPDAMSGPHAGRQTEVTWRLTSLCPKLPGNCSARWGV